MSEPLDHGCGEQQPPPISRVPLKIREALTSAFAKTPVSAFPGLPENKVVEVSADASIAETVEMLSKHNIFSAPVRNTEIGNTQSWSERYIGIVDYGAIILWVLEQADLSAVALAVGSAAAAGVGAGAVGALGALALGATGPAAVAGLTVAAVGAALAGGVAVERGMSKDAVSAVDALGEDFYKIILSEEPFKSMKVSDITRSYRWTPFLPVKRDDCMLTLLLLLSKHRLRSVPIVEVDQPYIKSFVTQSAVVKGLCQCKGRDWFDEITRKTLDELGLPLVGSQEVISIDSEKLVLEAFTLMREKQIGGLPVLDSNSKQIVGNISLPDVQHLLLKAELFAKHKSLTILEFMEILHSKSSDPSSLKMMPPITCTSRETLGDVIERLSEKHIHRVYVVDDSNCVLGVMTLRDIICCFVLEPPHYFDGYFGGLFEDILKS